MIGLLGQASEVANLGSKAIDASSQYGGEIWLLSVVLISVASLVALYTWKIGIPNANAHRDNSEKLATAITALVPPVSETNIQIRESNETLMRTSSAIRAMASCRGAECAALEKLASKAGVDVSAELGQIRGAMLAAESIVST